MFLVLTPKSFSAAGQQNIKARVEIAAAKAKLLPSR